MDDAPPVEDVRKIGRVGRYSYCVTLPKPIIRALGWRSRQRVVVSREGDTIVIRDWEAKPRGGGRPANRADA